MGSWEIKKLFSKQAGRGESAGSFLLKRCFLLSLFTVESPVLLRKCWKVSTLPPILSTWCLLRDRNASFHLIEEIIKKKNPTEHLQLDVKSTYLNLRVKTDRSVWWFLWDFLCVLWKKLTNIYTLGQFLITGELLGQIWTQAAETSVCVRVLHICSRKSFWGFSRDVPIRSHDQKSRPITH